MEQRYGFEEYYVSGNAIRIYHDQVGSIMSPEKKTNLDKIVIL